MLTNNMPKVKIGIVAVSRDCFPESLSVNRRKAVVQSYIQHYNSEDIYECPVCIVESEIQMVQALEDIKQAGCNALCVYLGNFGPEIAETLLAKQAMPSAECSTQATTSHCATSAPTFPNIRSAMRTTVQR